MNKDLTGSLAWGGGIIVVGLVATFARKMGYIDNDTATRIVFILIGLMVAWYGNRMPKAWVASDVSRKVTRIGGWSMSISGLIYAVLWGFAPISTAIVAGCGALVLGVLATIAYAISLKSKAKSA